MKMLSFVIVLLTGLPCTSAQTVLYTFDGDSALDSLGYSVSGAGDVNRDGYPDLIVGVPFDDNNYSQNSGSARVFSGLDGSVLYTFDGDSASDWFGYSVSGAGDVNRDGYPDLIVGALNDDNNGPDAGSARVFSGLDGSVLYTFDGDSAFRLFGYSVSGAGDVNGDGHADLIVGAPSIPNSGVFYGSARVFSGLDGSVLYTFYGDAPDDRFGFSVSGAGDVNGDGYPDLIVGAYSDDNRGVNSGRARVFSGLDGSVLYTFDGDSAGDRFGVSVSGAGDVNGDGNADLIVGAYLDDPNGTDSGSARVFSGLDGSVLYTFKGDSPTDWLGSSVSGAGDVNGDGYSDLIVGVPYDDNNGTDSGSARVFSGLDGSMLRTFDGDSAGDISGWSVSGAGDVNGDGYANIIVGAFNDDNNALNCGSARVLGVDPPLSVWAPATGQIGSALGYTVSSVPAQPFTPYVFDISITGNSPGLALGPPGSRVIPLNPPLLALEFGTLLPGHFTGFVGVLDAAGQAQPVFNIPAVPVLFGITIHAAAVTLDPLGSSGIGDITRSVATTLL